MNTIWHNGHWVEDGAIFTSSDRVRFGDGIFDTMLAIIDDSGVRLIHADLHFNRLLHDAQLLEIHPLPTLETLTSTAAELLTKNNAPHGRHVINTIISRGEGPRGLMPPEKMSPTTIMRHSPAPETFPAITAITARRAFRNEGSPLSQVKSCNYGDNILALIEARNKGANDAIMLNNAGKITCTTSGNIFVINNGTLYTPPLSDGVMNGITRKIMLDTFKVIECSLDINDLRNADGIYITNSVRGIMPLTTLNGQPVPTPSITIEQDAHIS
jgi:branched-chain amino acid aminotransferase